MYISSSLDLVENVEMGNDGSSRIPENAPVRESVEINSSSSSGFAKEAAAGATVQTEAFSANVTRRQKPRDPGIYAKGAIDGIKVNFTIDSGASLTSVSYHIYQKIPENRQPKLREIWTNQSCWRGRVEKLWKCHYGTTDWTIAV